MRIKLSIRIFLLQSHALCKNFKCIGDLASLLEKLNFKYVDITENDNFNNENLKRSGASICLWKYQFILTFTLIILQIHMIF